MNLQISLLEVKMNKISEHNKKAEVLLFSSLTAAALGLVSINTNSVRADSLSASQLITQNNTIKRGEKKENSNLQETNSANQTEIKQNDGQNTDEPHDDKQKPTDTKGQEPSSDNSNNDSNTKSIIQKKWNDLDVEFDTTSKELTVHGSSADHPVTLTNPKPLKGIVDDEIKKITFKGKVQIAGSAKALFNGLSELTDIAGMANFDTANTTDMSNMFSDCSSLKVLDISNFDMSKVSNNDSMLAGLKKLLVLKLGPNVKNLKGTGLDTEGTWLSVGKGTIDQPEATDKWSSTELINNWNGKKEAYAREIAILVSYQDEAGKDLLPAESITGTYGKSYEAKAKDIPGYFLFKTPENASGIFGDNTQAINFVYRKYQLDNQPVKGAAVTVHYQDEKGNELTPPVVISGNLGDGYVTETKEIKGYTLDDRTDNATGFFASQPQDVIYIYTKDKSDVTKPEENPTNTNHKKKGHQEVAKQKKRKNKTGKKQHKRISLTAKDNYGHKTTTFKPKGAKEKAKTLAQTGLDKMSQLDTLLLGALAIILSLFGVKLEHQKKE